MFPAASNEKSPATQLNHADSHNKHLNSNGTSTYSEFKLHFTNHALSNESYQGCNTHQLTTKQHQQLPQHKHITYTRTCCETNLQHRDL